ncbi:MAG TPA: aldehyde dehydrogenase family protein, partial [Thermoanaerobaculia bacterium]
MTTTAEPPPLTRPVESRDPNTGEVWQTFQPASRGEIATAVATARDAQKRWREGPLRERARAIDRVRREIYARRDLLATTLQREIGKPAFDALFEVLITA